MSTMLRISLSSKDARKDENKDQKVMKCDGPEGVMQLTVGLRHCVFYFAATFVRFDVSIVELCQR